MNPDQQRDQGGLLVPAGRRARGHRRAAAAAASGCRGAAPAAAAALGADFDEVVRRRRAEADEFYAELTPAGTSADAAMVMRQAFAGMLWSKQLFDYDVARWLAGDPTQPTPPAARLTGRNARWSNFDAFDIMSMPDKWEYPWFAAWDLAFHCVALAHVDPAFAKYQLVLLCREWFQHPNGALPAYEWDFGDVNPPVQAWAALEVFAIDGATDVDFLSRVFDKLLVNFTWWVNRQDESGSNLFEGGFLGLDNIGPLDRSHLPVGGTLQQSDATGWMASYALAMAAIASILNRSGSRPASDLVLKFLEHFAAIRQAMDGLGVWDETDGLYYDKLVTPDGTVVPVKVRSMVGIIPLLAVAVVDEPMLARAKTLGKQFTRFLDDRGLGDREQLAASGLLRGEPGSLLLGVVGVAHLTRLFERLFDEAEFLSPYGLRALSAYHREHPYELDVEGVRGHDRLRAGRVDHGHVRRQLELAGPAVVPAELPPDQRPRALLPLLRRRAGDRVPDRVGAAAHARRDRRGPAPATRVALPQGSRRAAAVLRHVRAHAERPGVERQRAVQRVLPRRHRRRARRHPPDRLDRCGRRPHPRPSRTRRVRRGRPAARHARTTQPIPHPAGRSPGEVMTLDGKVAIVTGGNSGIGKAVALALAGAGAKIVIDYVANEQATEDLERQIAALGDQSIGVEADVSKVADLERLIGEAVKAFGRLDIMVNNAGVETRTSVLDTTEAQYDKVLDINLKSAFFGTQIAAKQMIAQGGGGRIINITSVHEDWPMPDNTAYCLSKGGMRMLTRTAGRRAGAARRHGRGGRARARSTRPSTPRRRPIPRR